MAKIPNIEDWIAKRKEEVGRCFSDGLLINLYSIWRAVNYHDFDSFIVIDGKERYGKSTLAAQIAATLDPTFSIDKNNLDFKDFVASLEKGKKGDCLVFDEAGTGLLSRETMHKLNTTLVKSFMISGAKNMIIILAMPNYFMIDKYIRDHRVNALIHVPKRSFWWFYDEKKASTLSKVGYKFMNHNAVKPLMTGRFNKAFPKTFPEHLYKEKKQRYIDKNLAELKAVFEGDKFKSAADRTLQDEIPRQIRLVDLARKVGIPAQTLRKKVSLKEIKGYKKFGRWYFSEEEALRIGKMMIQP